MLKSRRARVGAACLLIAGALAGSPSGTVALGSAAGAAQERPVVYPPFDERRFEIDVLVGGAPLEEFYARGRNYVEALRGEEYELRVRNPLPVRVAVALSVDGLNTIDARRTPSWDASKWVIEPYGTIRVGGWQMSTERARRFYFTSEPDSYAARLGRASDLGLITAVFYREVEREPVHVTPPPLHRRAPKTRAGSDEPDRSEAGEYGARESRSSRAPGASAKSAPAPAPDDDYAATGIGRSVSNHVRWVNMSLARRPAAELSIRYEFRPALVKLGILPRPRPETDTLRRRERARGFEDREFSPEP